LNLIVVKCILTSINFNYLKVYKDNISFELVYSEYRNILFSGEQVTRDGQQYFLGSVVLKLHPKKIIQSLRKLFIPSELVSRCGQMPLAPL
jgi:hypothetical protein